MIYLLRKASKIPMICHFYKGFFKNCIVEYSEFIQSGAAHVYVTASM